MPSAVVQPSGISPLAGQAALKENPIDVFKIEWEYQARRLGLDDPNRLVSSVKQPPLPHEAHLDAIIAEARMIVNHALAC